MVGTHAAALVQYPAITRLLGALGLGFGIRLGWKQEDQIAQRPSHTEANGAASARSSVMTLAPTAQHAKPDYWLPGPA